MYKIYTYPANSNVAKALIAAEFNNLSNEIVLPYFKMGEHNKTPEFLAKFPRGKVPAMDTPHGPLVESDAIALYLAKQRQDTQLLGKNAYEESLVHAWMDWEKTSITPHFINWVYPILGYIPYNAASTEMAKTVIKKELITLNQHLATRTYLVGERITLADICVSMNLMKLYRSVMDAEYRKDFPNVDRWFFTLINQPQFKPHVSFFKLCEKMAVYDPNAKKEEAKKEEPKKEQAAPAQAEQPKQEKKKNPLDLLPPSDFVLDTWKRFYSNNDEKVAIEYFWNNFDKEGYSIWKCSFKYNEENKKIFMSCNLLNGFFQRAEHARKYAFGSFGIFGEDDDNEIHGIWVFRGQDIPFEIRDCPDSESYEFTKFENLDDEQTKKTINAFLAWDELGGLGEFTGITRKFNQGKNYK